MMTSSNGNIFRPLWEEFTGDRWISPTKANVFFGLHRNKRLSKQLRHWCFQTPSHSLWRHCDVMCITDSEGMLPKGQNTIALGLINAKKIIRLYKNLRDKNYIHKSRLTVLGYPVNMGRSYTAPKGRPISVPPMSAPIVDTRISAILLFSGVFLRLSLSINNNLITT